MQKKSQEDYRNAVAQSIINARDDIRIHRNTLSDHDTTLETHATELENHTLELADHETRVDTVELELHYTPGICVDDGTGAVWAFMVGTDQRIYKSYRAYGGSFNAWADSGLLSSSGVSAHWDAKRLNPWIAFRGATTGNMKVYYYSGGVYTDYSPPALEIF